MTFHENKSDLDNFEEKISYLTKNNFKEIPQRGIFVEPSTQTVVSLEYIEDHNLKEIQKKIAEITKHNEKPNFIFNTTPSATTTTAITMEIFPNLKKSE